MTRDHAELAVNTIRALVIDAVEEAGCGHPGMPMGMAEVAVVVWGQFLTIDPDKPDWPDRDRFVLSNGHGSMLLYALLHLSGFDLPLDELRRFRQWGSATPGHPEYGHTPGVETTTGPLGQGFANGVGMAIAEANLRAEFGADLVDHRVFGFVSDGDLMEGVASEAASLAGHLGLGRLIYLYDDNEISIDGSTDLTFTEDVAARFASYGWHVETVDGHDPEAIAPAVERAIAQVDRPSLISCRTVIGRGAPTKQGTAAIHGAPLGPEEAARAKAAMGWPTDAAFHVPDEAYGFFEQAMKRGRIARQRWEGHIQAAFAAEPELTRRWSSRFRPAPVTLEPPAWPPKLATRAASGTLFDQIELQAPGLMGGSADLASSTKTRFPTAGDFGAATPRGRNIAYGVREHAMGAIANGITLHGGARGYGSTFLVFSDYMRPAIRLAALMKIPTVFVFTHDSIMLGEDGPTHQPVEHLASLRAIPGLRVIRPADANETAEAWELALNHTDGPTALILTRQDVPTLESFPGGVARGGHVIRDGGDAVVVATGSEVALALEVAELVSSDLELRVVSLPCWELFEQQDVGYRREVLGNGIPVISLEAGTPFGWSDLVGTGGLVLGVEGFGASAPGGVLAHQLGLSAIMVAERITRWMRSQRPAAPALAVP